MEHSSFRILHRQETFQAIILCAYLILCLCHLIKLFIARFEGKKEGTILENSSYYILTQCPDGVFEAVPVQAWYSFNPAINYHTLSLDEVEKEFSRRDKTLNYHNLMVQKRLQANEEKEDEVKSKVKSTYNDDLV